MNCGECRYFQYVSAWSSEKKVKGACPKRYTGMAYFMNAVERDKERSCKYFLPRTSNSITTECDWED